MAREGRRTQDHAGRCTAEAQSPAALLSLHHLTVHLDMPNTGPAKGTERSEARPAPARQNNRFWIAPAILTVIVPPHT